MLLSYRVRSLKRVTARPVRERHSRIPFGMFTVVRSKIKAGMWKAVFSGLVKP